MDIARKCAVCGSRNVSRSGRRNLIERLLSLARILPYRCLDCNHRFFLGARKG
ncbi:MAG: hypothetical protein QOC99_228 [Acidobacteriota bacterium]|jgi:DNA-directed RNA polymerase subunit RPC12/RpoP|nr:hypothetical protein [Acidobacteriota bacterium]